MNLKILLVEPNLAISNVIEKNLVQVFGAEVEVVNKSQLAKELLSTRQFSLVIARNKNESEIEEEVDHIAEVVLNAIYDYARSTPIIIIGQFEHTYKKYALVSERLRIEEINRLVLKALNLKKEDFKHLKLPDYIPFPTTYFYLMTISPCDIYIKLSKKSGDEFVKRLHLGENFTKENLKKYEELGLQEFYILKEEYDDFLNGLMYQTLSKLKSIGKNASDSIEVIADAYSMSSALLRSLGLEEQNIEMVNQTIEAMKNQLVSNDKLGSLLKKLLDDQLSYSYRHSYMTSLIASIVLPKMEWGSGDQLQVMLEKICMVSFFHDIYLEDEKLIKIQSQASLKDANLNSKEMDLVLNHANKSAMLLQQYPKLPQGVDLIVKQHHGVSNGVGFYDVLTSALSPMAIFYIVIEDFALNLINVNDLSKMNEIIEHLKAKYQLPSYRKIVQEIENLLKVPKKA